MKTTNRIPKAIAVVVVVGLGLVHNMENKHHILAQSISELTQEWENRAETDTLKASENKLFNYTKLIIKTSIENLISNI